MNSLISKQSTGRWWLVGFVALLALAGCGGGGSGSAGGNVDHKLNIVSYNSDYDTAGGDLRLAEQMEIAVVETATGVQDNCLYLSDDKQSYVSAPYTWTVSNNDLVELEEEFSCTVVMSAKGVGNVTLTATNDYNTVSRTFAVDPALLVSISITPEDASVYKGLSQAYTATGHYSDSTTRDLTSTVSWTASDTSLASFSDDTAGLLTGSEEGEFSVVASAVNDLDETIESSVAATVTPAAVTAITVDSELTLPLGRVQALSAQSTFTDSTSENLADDVTWVVADETIASIDSSGTLTATAQGETTLYAVRDNNYGETITSNVMTLTVEDRLLDSIEIAAVNEDLLPIVDGDTSSGLKVGINRSEEFSITGTYSTGETVEFAGDTQANLTSSDTSVATFSHSGGTTVLATLAEGDTTLTASVVNRRGNPVADTFAIRVNKPNLESIVIETADKDGSNNLSTLIKGDELTFVATGYFDDDSVQNLSSNSDIVWASSNSSVLAFNDGSDDPTAYGVATGSVTVSASMINEEGDTITSNGLVMTVLPAVVRSIRIEAINTLLQANSFAVPQGLSNQLQVVGVYSDESEAVLSDVSWASADENYVTVASNGTVTATKTSDVLGDVLVAAAVTVDGNDFNAQVTLTVTEPVLTSLAVELGDDTSGFWKGRSQAFKASGGFSNDETRDLTSSVSWSLRADDLNRVSQSANTLQLDEEGAVQFTASYTDTNNDSEITSDTYSFTVKPALLESLAVTALNQYGLQVGEVPSGRQQQFTATGTYSDASTAVLTDSVSWSSSLPAKLSIVASGTDAGLASALSPTNDTDALAVSATVANAEGTDISASLDFVVAGAALESIYLQLPSTSVYNGKIPLGGNEQIQLMGRYSDNTDREIDAGLASWSSSDESLAVVGASTGIVTAQVDQVIGSSFVITAVELTSGESFEGSLTLQNATAVFESIRIEPDTSDSAWLLAEGGQYQFQAYAEYTDGSEVEITSDVASGSTTETIWALVDSSQSSVVTVDNRTGFKGLVTGVAEAEDQINTLQVSKVNSLGSDISQTATVTVGGPMLAAIEIKPADVSLATGDTQALTANGLYTNNTEVDLTDEVEWSSPRQDVVQFNSVQPNLAEAISAGTSLIIATYPAQNGQQAFTGYRQINVEAKALRSLAITPAVARSNSSGDALFLMGLTDQLTLTGTYSDSSTEDLTSSVSWSSSDESIVTISSAGVLTPVAQGTATLTASQDIVELGESKTISISYDLEIGAALLQSIELEPQSPVVPVSTRKQFTAWGRYSDGSRVDITQLVDWETGYKLGADESSKVGVITDAVSGAGGGVFTAQFAGQIAVTATLENADEDEVSAATLATTKALDGLVLELDQTNLYKGQSATLTALGELSDGTTAEFADGISWTVNTPTTLSIDVTSTSSQLTINAIAAGAGQITASRTLTDGSVVSNSWSITVQSPLLESIVATVDVDQVPLGMTRQLTATGHYSDDSTAVITTSVDWNSANTARATVDSSGLISTLATGSVALSASLDNAEGDTISSNSLTFTVQAKTVKAITVSPATATVALGRQQQLSVNGTYSDDSDAGDVSDQVTWQSSNTSVAIVDANGLLTTLATGSAVIEATIADALETASGSVDITSSASLTVAAAQLNEIEITGAPSSLADGLTAQLSVSGTNSDGSSAGTLATSSVSWFSTDTSVASVTAAGLVTARAQGQATIQISTTLDNGETATDSVTLTITAKQLQSIAITAASSSVAAGRQVQLTATGTYTDGSTEQPLQEGFVWQSGDTAAAIVSASGKVTAQDVSSSTSVSITAAGTASGVTVTPVSLTVEPAVLEQLIIAGNGSSVAVGSSQTFSVSGYDSLGNSMTSVEVGTVQWSTSDTGLATINSSTGELTGVSAGTVTVLASKIVGTTTVADEIDVLIGDAELSSIKVLAADGSAAASVGLGMQHSFSATGVYTDSSEVANLGTGFSWAITSATGTAAGVIAADGTLTVTEGANGDTLVVTVTPSQSSVTVSQTVTVTIGDAELVQLTIAENGVVVPVCQLAAASCQSNSLTQDMTVTGLDSYGTSVSSSSLTDIVWTVSDTSVARIDSSSGELTGISEGTVVVTAQKVLSDRMVSATATVLVGDAELVSLEVLSAANQSSITIAEGRQHQLTVTGSYSNGVEVTELTGLTWAVTPTTDATIDANGLLTANSGTSGNSLTVTVTHNDSGVNNTASVTVTDAEIVSMTLLQASTTLPINTTDTLTLQLLDSAAQSCLVTNVGSGTACSTAQIAAVSWSSSDATVAKVDENGLITALNYGTVTIEASMLTGPSWDRQQLTTSATVVVEGKALQSISLSPSTDSIAAGNQLQMVATGTYSDSSVATLTSGFVWQSADSATAYISPTGLITGRSVSSDTAVTITVVPDDSSVSVTSAIITITPAELRQLYVSANGATVAIGDSRTFTVTGTDTLGNAMSAVEVGTVEWSVSDTAVASINSSTGVLTGVSTGTVTVMASQLVSGFVVYGEADVVIGSAVLSSIEVASESDTSAATVAVGRQHQLSATGVYSDGTRISDLATGFSWTVTSATNSAAATIDSNGLLTITDGAASDTLVATVTPSTSGVTVDQTVTVTLAAAELASMTIQQRGLTLPVCNLSSANCVTAGATQTMSAAGRNTDGTSVTAGSITGISWSVSDTSIAQIDESTGVLQGIATGSVVVTAEKTVSGNLITDTATVLIGDASLSSIDIQSEYGQSSVTVGLGTQHALKVVGSYTNLVELDDLSGISWEITTSPAPQAYISSDGVVTVYGGSASDTFEVQATHDDTGKTATETVTLTDEELVALLLHESTATMGLGDTLTLTLELQDSLAAQCYATNVGSNTACDAGDIADLIWSSSDSSVASIDSSTGEITGVNEGIVDITAQLLAGPGWNRRLLTASASVVVGSATLTSIDVTPSTLTSLAAGSQRQLAITGNYSNGISQSLDTSEFDWTVTSTPTGASVVVSPTGLVSINTNVGAGDATPVVITATSRDDSSLTDTLSFTIDDEILASLSIAESGQQVAQGGTLALTLTGTDSLGNAATAAMLSGVQWSSSNTLIATVPGTGSATTTTGGAAAETVDVTGVNEGTVTIYAVQDLGSGLGTVRTSALILGGDADVTAISIDSAGQTSIAEGRQLQFSATATYSNGIEAPISSGLTWAVASVPDGEVVVSIDASTGLLTVGAETCSGASCQVSVTVTHDDTGTVSTATVLDVEAAELASLTINEHGNIVATGATEALTVTAFDTLGADISTPVPADLVWSVSDTSLATIDQSGNLTGVAAGTVNVTVSKVVGTTTRTRTVVDEASIVIGSATLNRYRVTTSTGASTISMSVGDVVDFEVEAGYTDGTAIGDVKTGYSWSSSTTDYPGSTAAVTIDANGKVTLDAGASGDKIDITVTADSGTPAASGITQAVITVQP